MKYLFLAFIFSLQLLANDGEQLFDSKCSMCHIKTKPTKEIKKELIAPPISGVVRKIKRAFPNIKDGVAFMQDYIYSPALSKSKCKTKAIDKFGLMPSQKGVVSVDELEKIGQYLYSNFPFPKKEKKSLHVKI